MRRWTMDEGRWTKDDGRMTQNDKRSDHRKTDPMHGVTLQDIVERLVEHYGWEALGKRIRIRSFRADPSVKSSLTFLRKTPWARQQVEKLYREMMRTKS